MSSLPKSIQVLIDNAYIAANVLGNLGADVLSASDSMAHGAGVLANCTFMNFTEDATLWLSEDRSGRLVIALRNTTP